jgi:hypothetical protein
MAVHYQSVGKSRVDFKSLRNREKSNEQNRRNPESGYIARCILPDGGLFFAGVCEAGLAFLQSLHNFSAFIIHAHKGIWSGREWQPPRKICVYKWLLASKQKKFEWRLVV